MIAAVWLSLAGVGADAAVDDPCKPAWHPFVADGQIGEVDGAARHGVLLHWRCLLLARITHHLLPLRVRCAAA
jgi:hypothetical protein